jgi:endonuclease/exonuclease/phosphatase family metal-dependent hydrolase
VALAGAVTSGRAAGSWTSSRNGSSLRELQFNLCDSGIAGCYTGRAVRSAATVIRGERPDVVTLNEVCRKDVATLARALSTAHSNHPVAAAFKAARNRPTGGPFRCVNGQSYGIGVLALLGSTKTRYRTYSGVYPQQDLGDPEERVWVCLDLPTGLLACTTHTASTSRTVALAQCRYFLNTALPAIRRHVGDLPATLGADLNLRAHGAPSPQSCLPSGYQRAGDGLLQDVIASHDFAVRSRTVIDMHGATDHPGLLVDLTVRSRAAVRRR